MNEETNEETNEAANRATNRPRPTLAMVLAAGHGKRFLPITASRAKPALPFVGRPILSHVLDGLANAGVERAIVNLHHAPDSVREVVADRGDAPPHVTWSDETDTLLDTGGALVPVRDVLAREEDFYLVNGDCVHEIDYEATWREHVEAGASATLSVRATAEPGFGALLSDPGGTITDFGVPAAGAAGERHFLSVQVVSHRLLETLPDERRPFSTFRDWYPRAREAGHVFRASVTDAEWHALDTPERYLEATRAWLATRDRPHDVASTAVISDGAEVGAGSAIHAGCTVGLRSVIRETVLMDGARVGDDCTLVRCVVGHGADVPPGTQLTGETLAAASDEVEHAR